MSYLDQLFSLENQTAVIIGGTGTLCGEMAQGIAQAGANTIIVGRSAEKVLTVSPPSRPQEAKPALSPPT